MKKNIDKNKRHRIRNAKNEKIKKLTKKIEKNKRKKGKKIIFYRVLGKRNQIVVPDQIFFTAFFTISSIP